MTLLQKRDAERQRQRALLFHRTRAELREALYAVLPASRVVVFGSLTQPGRFNPASDIDLALFAEPGAGGILQVMTAIEERMCRSVDIVLLGQTRLREKILREGEVWTT